MTADDWQAALSWGVTLAVVVVAIFAATEAWDRWETRRQDRQIREVRRQARRAQAWELVQALGPFDNRPAIVTIQPDVRAFAEGLVRSTRAVAEFDRSLAQVAEAIREERSA